MSDDAIEPLEKRVAAILEDEHPDSAALATVLRDEDVGDIAVVDKLEPKQGELVLRALDEGRAAELLTQLEPGLTRELICCYAASGPGGRCCIFRSGPGPAAFEFVRTRAASGAAVVWRSTGQR